MVLCLFALPIFLILGIFSVKYRKLAKDSLDCIFHTVTLRKCGSNLDERIKGEITSRIFKFSPKTAGFVYSNYKVFSWIIFILLIWSTYESAIGIHNYYYYGNCNGPESTGFCLFDPAGTNTKISGVDIDAQKELIPPVLEADDPIIGDKGANLTIIEFGCYLCPYTKKAEPTMKEILDYYGGKVNLQFKTFIIPHHNLSYPATLSAECAAEQDKYGEYHDYLFEHQDSLANLSFEAAASQLNLNMTQFNDCVASEKYRDEINEDTLMGVHAGVSGTPTFFINGREIAGPKPFRTFQTIIDEELKNV